MAQESGQSCEQTACAVLDPGIRHCSRNADAKFCDGLGGRRSDSSYALRLAGVCVWFPREGRVDLAYFSLEMGDHRCRPLSASDESRVRGKEQWSPTSREKRARYGAPDPLRRNQRQAPLECLCHPSSICVIEQMRSWGLRPIVFGPGTLWRTWGTRPIPSEFAMRQTPVGLGA